MKAPTVWLVMVLALVSCSAPHKYASLQRELEGAVRGKDARIGVAVIVDSKDTVCVNGDRPFPMLSVYKFPIALALAQDFRAKGYNFTKPIHVTAEDLHIDTYSPMTEKILASGTMMPDSLDIPTSEILMYMLQWSDNNASDLAMKTVGGSTGVMQYLRALGIEGINVVSTEAEMHDDNSLCYRNSATPLAMARLMDRFDTGFHDPLSLEIKGLMETCETGKNRLPKPLRTMDAVVGHKTGTGFALPGGGIMAVNDAGYVHLPDGRRYAIAVFVADSHYTLEQTEAIIASISQMVLNAISKNTSSSKK